MNATTPPVLPTRTKGPRLLATFITLIVVPALLAMLLMNIAFTGMFLRRPPHGENAMGLVIPFFGLAATILAFTLAAALAAVRAKSSAVGVLSSSPLFAGFLVIAITLGAALAAGMAFMLWCEPGAAGRSLRAVTIPVGILLGVCGPVVLAAMLLASAWLPKSEAAAALAAPGALGLALKAGFVVVCLLALSGYGLGGAMFWKEIQRVIVARTSAVAGAVQEQVRWQVGGRSSLTKQLTDELARLPPDAPLSSFIVYLPVQPGARALDEACRDLVIQRALRVADIDGELAGCMKSRQYLDRQAAAEFLISVPAAEFAAHRDAWGRALLLGLEATGDGIYCRPAWLSETFDSKPDPLGHVRSLLAAADRFKDWGEYANLRQHFKKMAEDAEMLKEDSKRGKLLKMLADDGYHAPALRAAPSR